MKFHPRNGQIVARQLEDEELDQSGLRLVVTEEKRPVQFVAVVEIAPRNRKLTAMPSNYSEANIPEYKKDDILAINPTLVIPMGWLAHNYLVFPEHQVLAVVEIEKDDNVKGEAWDRDKPP